jgi:hypothetical protein
LGWRANQRKFGRTLGVTKNSLDYFSGKWEKAAVYSFSDLHRDRQPPRQRGFLVCGSISGLIGSGGPVSLQRRLNGQDNPVAADPATRTSGEHQVADSYALDDYRLLRPPGDLRQFLVALRLCVLSGIALDEAIADGVLDHPTARRLIGLIGGPPADAVELELVRASLGSREIIVNWQMLELELMLQRAGDAELLSLKAENELRHRLVRQLVEPLS